MWIKEVANLTRAWPLLLAGLALSSPAAAQDQRVITFEEALRIAVERNPTVLLAENSAELNTIAVRQQRMQFLPDLRVNSSTSQSYGRNFSQDEGRIINQSTNSVSGGLSSSVTLFNGFSNNAALAQARMAVTAGEADLERTRQTVVFTVMSNYLTLLQRQEQLRVQEQNLQSQEAQEAQIRAYVEAGARPISDLYQQQASLASARLALVQGQRALELARMQLIQTLQLDPFGEYQFEAPTLTGASEEALVANLQTLSEQAFAQRADLQAAAADLSIAEQGIRVANATRWPSLSLNLGYNSGFNSLSDASFWDQVDQRRGGSIGLGISLPVWDRLNRSNANQRARIQVENAQINLQTLRQQVAIQIRTAQLDLRSAQEQLRQAEAQLQAAELALQASQERYDVGAATLVELTQSRSAHVQAASDLVTARYGLLFQDRLMSYYLGTMSAEQVVSP